MRIAELTALLGLVYFAFWAALALGLLIMAARGAAQLTLSPPESAEWRDGPAGFGLYTRDGYRVDPHVSDHD